MLIALHYSKRYLISWYKFILKGKSMTNEESVIYQVGLEKIWKKQCKTKENQKYAKTINEILNSYGIKEKINCTHIFRIKTETTDSLSLSYFQKTDKKRLSRIVENYIWDLAEKDMYIYHFTKEEIAKSIENSSTLKLYNILKRYNEGEIKDFIKDFEIPHTVDENYQEIYYSSFTTTIPNESNKSLVRKFRSFTGDWGARLKFRILKQDSNLKYINYDKSKFKLIHDLRKAMKDTHNIDLIINGFSTHFASFYVNEKYSHENEIRLYKNLLFDETMAVNTDEHGLTYINFNLNCNNLIKLEEVIYERKEEIFVNNLR